MARAKYDGVVEAVHYNSDGQVDWVRAYVRRGPIFSDRVKLNRQALVEQLKSGKRFLSGKRIPLMAATFEVYHPLRLLQNNGKEVLVAGEQQTNQDSLDGIPVI
jgi:hypothetical protein